MIVNYYVLDPTGNITILVDTPVPPGSMPFIASGLARLEPQAEQIGFFSFETDSSETEACVPAGTSDSSPVLHMAGGEFCGNASMCAAVLAAQKAGVSGFSTELTVSGASEPVPVHVEKQPDGSWRGSVTMPRPASFETIDLPEAGKLPVVRFDGISHVILEKRIEKAKAKSLIRKWCGLLHADALGLLFLDRNEKSLTPLVYVPAVNTLCWENSCASGTAAAGVYLSSVLQRPLALSLSQPGGSLSIDVSPEGRLTLSGTVKILKRGTHEID